MTKLNKEEKRIDYKIGVCCAQHVCRAVMLSVFVTVAMGGGVLCLLMIRAAGSHGAGDPAWRGLGRETDVK